MDIKYQLKTAVLFLIFNRPDTTKQVFEAIKKAQPLRLYIGSDGPRESKTGETKIVHAVREFVINNIDWDCEVKTLFRDRNLGCGNAVSSAISWFFDNEEAGIILEDDIMPSQSFFIFCEELLKKYKDEDKIWHIGGFNSDNSIAKGEGSYYFSKKVHVWGWATWKRAWKYYDFDMKSFSYFNENHIIERIFKYKDLQEYSIGNFKKCYEKRIDTWDYQWTYAILSHGGVAVIPNKNMISNIGFGANATHTKDGKSLFANIKRFEIMEICYPELISVNDKMDYDYFCKEYYGNDSFIENPLKWLKNKLKKLPLKNILPIKKSRQE